MWLLLLVFAPILVATDVWIPTTFGEFGVPCVYGYLVPEENLRCFIIRTSSNQTYLGTTNRNDYTRDISLSTDGEAILIDRSHATIPNDWDDWTDIIGIGFGSEFAFTVGSMMLLPTNIGSGISIITRPQNPIEYCHDEHMILINTNSTGTVRASVSLWDGQNNFELVVPVPQLMYDFRIEVMDSYTKIPQIVFDLVIDFAESLGIMRISGDELEVGCAEIIDQMPTIQFELDQHGIVRLVSDDYISVDPETGECTLSIQGFDQYQSFGRSVIANTAILFDYEHNVIGFCDPE